MGLTALVHGDTELAIDPLNGGSIRSASWRGEPILHCRPGTSVLDQGCFPLVPFSNRIAASRFSFGSERVHLSPNHPQDPQCPVLHGSGWLAEWDIRTITPACAQMTYRHLAGEWPWNFSASQTVTAFGDGFEVLLEIENLSDRAMPAGLGLHPYFPRTERTILRSLHRGEWQPDERQIPTELELAPKPVDWWDGAPVGTRIVDTVYTDRQGRLTIEWPERGLAARILPPADLSFTTVYVPEGEEFFCVEPVSHMTDAFNRPGEDSGMRVLEQGERWAVTMRIEVCEL